MSSEAGLTRAARPEDLEPFLQTLCAAFGIDMEAARPLFFRDPFFDLSHKRVLLTESDGLVSCLTVLPASLRIGGADVPVCGIAGVATHPSHQRCGHAGRLLAETIPALAEELHYPVSALFPYCPDFYRRFGWETASRATHWTALLASLPHSAESVFVRPVENDEDRAILHGLHTASIGTRTGAFTRDARRWTVIEALSPDREAVLYQGDSGACDGYLLYERSPDENGGMLTIHEMYGATQAARQGLVGFLARQADHLGQVGWEASSDDLRTFDLPASRQGESLSPPFADRPAMMLRLVDLRAALTCLHASLYAPILDVCDAALTLKATDSLVPHNEIPICLTKMGVESGTVAAPVWIAADIRVLAQIYIGYCTPSVAASEGRLAASSTEALALADRLFPARAPYVAPADQF